MRRITLRFILSAIGLCICCILLAFVIINLSTTNNNNSHEVKSQSVKCDCPSSQNAVVKIIPEGSLINSTVERSRPCKEVQQSSPVQRAIVIYYPHHQSEYFFPEVRW